MHWSTYLNRRIISFILLALAACQALSQISANDALRLASAKRPALAAARLRVEEARAAARSLGAWSALSIAAGASSRPDIGATDQDLSLTQVIDVFGRKRAAQGIGEAGVRRALAAYRAAAGELQAEVLTAFAEAVSAKHQSEVSAELLQVAESLYGVTKRRFDEGKVAELQVTRANIELERAKESADLRRAESDAAILRLSGLLGTGSERLDIEPDAVLEPLAAPSIDQRPDLLALNADVAHAEAEARGAQLAGRPEFSLQLVRSPWGGGHGSFGGRAQVTWDLFDHGRTRNEVRVIRFKAEAARQQLLDATARAQSELEAARVVIQARQARIRRYEAIIESARELVAKSQRGFSEGFGTQTDVLEATRALREVEQELVQAREQFSLAVIRQYKASGFLAEVFK